MFSIQTKKNPYKFLDTNGHSLVYSFFTRYINTISINQQTSQSNNGQEVFSIPINDKPPSYESVTRLNANMSKFRQKPPLDLLGTNVLIQPNYQTLNYQRQSSRHSSTTNSTFDGLPPYPGV